MTTYLSIPSRPSPFNWKFWQKRPQFLSGEINVGAEFIWEPTKTFARTKLRVTEVKFDPEGAQWLIKTKQLAGVGCFGSETWVTEEDFRRACVRL